MAEIKIDVKPFSWNDKMAQLAIEDFDSVRGSLPYCQAQSIGLALAKLKIIEEQSAPYNLKMVLEKILHEIEEYETQMEDVGVSCLCPGWIKDILATYLSDISTSSSKGSDDTKNNTELISVNDERLWEILFEEACIEGQQAERIHNRLKEICYDGWTAIKDGLPDKGENVLCYFKYEPESPDVMCDNMYIGSGKWQSESDRVTHWRKRPEKPRDGEGI